MHVNALNLTSTLPTLSCHSPMRSTAFLLQGISPACRGGNNLYVAPKTLFLWQSPHQYALHCLTSAGTLS
eukprot:14832450-Ditylum_brightwellii.AAC.1